MSTAPTKSRYVFDGWWTSWNDNGSQFTASTTVSSDMSVYAKWTAGATVTFNADGGTPATQTKTVNSGASVGSAMPSNPSRRGYNFDGWYT